MFSKSITKPFSLSTYPRESFVRSAKSSMNKHGRILLLFITQRYIQFLTHRNESGFRSKETMFEESREAM